VNRARIVNSTAPIVRSLRRKLVPKRAKIDPSGPVRGRLAGGQIAGRRVERA
jgi:hypothetical protein